MILAPCITACASLPIAILPCGISTAQVMPARAAYAAADAEVFPVDAHNTARWPRASASVTAIVMPRSLKEPVGLRPPPLRWTVQPVFSESLVAAISGVPPSSSVMGVQSSPTGNRSRYAAITPGHGWRVAVRGLLIGWFLPVAARWPHYERSPNRLAHRRFRRAQRRWRCE